MIDRMPVDLGELDERIGFDMLDHALEAAAAAERYTAERAAHIERHGEPDPVSFAKWSAASEPGTLSYGPFTPDPGE